MYGELTQISTQFYKKQDAVAIIYVQSQISLVFGEYSLCKNFPQYNEISQNSLRPSAAPFSTNLEKAKEDRLLDYGKRWVEKHLTRRLSKTK